MITYHILFIEITKAICLSVYLVPKLIQNFFSKMEQKLVQCCETEFVANACNASYTLGYFLCWFLAPTGGILPGYLVA